MNSIDEDDLKARFAKARELGTARAPTPSPLTVWRRAQADAARRVQAQVRLLCAVVYAALTVAAGWLLARDFAASWPLVLPVAVAMLLCWSPTAALPRAPTR